ncbi:Alkbh3 [Symbiodinium natans]|uniref:Alkbh3 protein n=1 Tax=Symbiodinium natans TaxID=878477 RepID=A0A812PG05_9DINO|nr:Alkbh3 [Symbiodinium natans]
MFEFEELEAALPHQAVVVIGAGSKEVNGLYVDTGVQAHGAPIFRHMEHSATLLAREPAGNRIGWLIGVNRCPYYGIRTDDSRCPAKGWRPFKGEGPAPRVEGRADIAEASICLVQACCDEADALSDQGRFRVAAEVLGRALTVPVLQATRAADIHGRRAKAFRQLAESKKKVRQEGEDDRDVDEDPLHGLAAEWAVEEVAF